MSFYTFLKDFAPLLCAVAGGIFALYQYSKNVKMKRADYLKQIVFKMREDTEIREYLQMVEYANFHYDESFHGSELELKADKTLEFLSYICYLYSEGQISQKEFSFFEYDILHVLKDEGVQRYLDYINRFANRVASGSEGVANFAFKYLYEYYKQETKDRGN